MTKNLIITFDVETNNFVKASKVEMDNIYLPVKVDTNLEPLVLGYDSRALIYIEEDVWSGISIYNKHKRDLSKLIKDYDRVILVIRDFSLILQGYVYNFAKFLKRKKKNLTIISNCNRVSSLFLVEIKKYCIIKDAYTDQEYQDFYQKYFPNVSICELDGLLNTIYLREIKKCA